MLTYRVSNVKRHGCSGLRIISDARGGRPPCRMQPQDVRPG
jgi:hypothetical protein